MDSWAKLRRMEEAVKLRAAGGSYAEVAAKLGVSSRTAHDWVKFDSYQKLIFDGQQTNPLRELLFDQLDEIAGRDLRKRRYFEYITPAEKFREVQNGIELAVMAA